MSDYGGARLLCMPQRTRPFVMLSQWRDSLSEATAVVSTVSLLAPQVIPELGGRYMRTLSIQTFIKKAVASAGVGPIT